MLNIVLFEPEIPANTGNIGRTCVVTGTRLHLIGPLGFSLDSRQLRRAGLGYWENLDVAIYDGWKEFLEVNGLAGIEHAAGSTCESRPRLHLLTKKARRTYAETTYCDGDFIVFGKESSGLPEGLLAAHADCCERIPMLADADSLGNRETWEAHEREVRGHGNDGAGDALTAGGHGNAAVPVPRAGDPSPLLAQDICGNFIDPDDFRISALNLSNAAAIVLYEALRQTGFPGM